MREVRPLACRKSVGEQEMREQLKRKFGAYIKFMRGLVKFSQTAAADRAGLSRVQWNRIENGHDLPKFSNIPAIADALYLRPTALYKLAGYPIPEWEQSYNKREVTRDVQFALEKSNTLAEFIFKMDMVWQEYQKECLRKSRWLKIDLTYAEVFASVIAYLSREKQLELARAILKRYDKS